LVDQIKAPSFALPHLELSDGESSWIAHPVPITWQGRFATAPLWIMTHPPSL